MSDSEPAETDEQILERLREGMIALQPDMRSLVDRGYEVRLFSDWQPGREKPSLITTASKKLGDK